MHPLDNIVWHALAGPQAHLGESRGGARRFHPDVSMFSCVAPDAPRSAWDDLADLTREAGFAALFAAEIAVPDGWQVQMRIPCLQMEATAVTASFAGPQPLVLGPPDVDDMLALVAQTQPGPFGTRTLEMGTYLGYREEGRLVAMAGERFRTDGFTEISAVCTVPDVRGRGLSSHLMLALIERIRDRGEEAVLHVVVENAPAIAIYERLGFTVRRSAEAVVVQRPG